MHNYYFFWGGLLSNWANTPFRITIDNKALDFKNSEQYMMYCKAILFHDFDSAKLILNTPNPKKVKELGRKVKGFNPETWDECKYSIVKRGLLYKFTQNKEALQILIDNQNKLFVEASPYDRIWGIGYDSKEAMSNIHNWGENLLGKIITEISKDKDLYKNIYV